MKVYLNISVEFLPQDKGGRKNPNYLNGKHYRPHFVVDEDKELLGIEFVEGPDKSVLPGERVNAKVVLLFYPGVSYDLLRNGREFSIVEGPKVVGRGIVIGNKEIVDDK